jgi:formylglycine-generating enzyme required for sulfatase activity
LRKAFTFPGQRIELRVYWKVFLQSSTGVSGHQDLKPEHLFCTTAGQIKITGFETARLGEFLASRAASRAAAMPRSPSYFAPEFAEGTPASPASDIYAIGLCLYELLAGQPAYVAGGKTSSQAAMSVLRQHQRSLPDVRQYRHDIPDELLAILRRATARHPAERFATAEDFAAALAPLAGRPLGPPRDATGSLTLAVQQRMPMTSDDPKNAAPRHSPVRSIDDEPSVIALNVHEAEAAAAPEPAAAPESPPSLEITAPQPSPMLPPNRLRQAAPAAAPVKEPVVVKLQYLLLGVLLTLFMVGGTAAATAYFLRLMMTPPGTAPELAARTAPVAAPPVASPPAHAPAREATPPASGATAVDSDMVVVAAGVFRMGSRDGYPDERPEHIETMSTFSLDKREVTVAQYDKCVQAGECRKQRSVHQSGIDHKFDRFCNYGRKSREQHPMNCVDWFQARAYCRWAGKRLPTEAEWEYAARGSDGRKFPWGNDPPGEHRLNACGSECVILGDQIKKEWEPMYSADDGWDSTAPVGSFPQDLSPYGVLDMAGNVAEWTDTEYARCYRDDCESDGKERVFRGGAWNDDNPRDVRTSYRNRGIPQMRASFVGFRCARSEAPAAPAR